MNVLADLDRLFPGYRLPERVTTWEAIKKQFAYGQSVTGMIVAKHHFGAWVDLGVGFPALLEVIDVAGLTPERYRTGDWCPIGSEVTAFIGHFNSEAHQIGLWQVPVGQGRSTPASGASDAGS